MAMPAGRVRDKTGKFSTKRKLKWKENLSIACKRRKVQTGDPSDCIIEGRRIVDVAKLAEEMWCRACDVPLSFRYVVHEAQIGLASVFTIKCHVCLLLYDVHTSKWHQRTDISCREYAVNLKSAIAILDCGIGTTHLNTILSELNIPTVHDTSTKRYERIVGKSIEEIAKESCREALRLEKHLTEADHGRDFGRHENENG